MPRDRELTLRLKDGRVVDVKETQCYSIWVEKCIVAIFIGTLHRALLYLEETGHSIHDCQVRKAKFELLRYFIDCGGTVIVSVNRSS